jgi:hypothetical protein
MIKIYCDSCKKEIERGLEHNIDINITGKDCNMLYFLNLCPKCKEKFQRMIYRIARKYGAR